MAKQKVYVQESYIYEYEIDTETIDVEEFIKQVHPTVSIGMEFGYEPASIQYMVEDSEWVEIHSMED
jgi:hypothetical protein